MNGCPRLSGFSRRPHGRYHFSQISSSLFRGYRGVLTMQVINSTALRSRFLRWAVHSSGTAAENLRPDSLTILPRKREGE